MNLTDNDRRIIVLCIFALGFVALAGGILLAGIVVWRLNTGEDVAPGIAAVIIGLFAIATNAGSLLAPSPLSKTSGSSDPISVVGPDGGPVPVVADTD